MTSKVEQFAQQFNKDKSVRQYLKDKKGNKIAMLLAFKDENGVHVGWSKCKTRAKDGGTDKFNKNMAVYIAVNRARKFTPLTVFQDRNTEDFTLEVPHIVKKFSQKFLSRIEKYYKCNLS